MPEQSEQDERNKQLRKASDAIKEHAVADSVVEIVWQDRKVTVNGEDAFTQGKGLSATKFVGRFGNLSL